MKANIEIKPANRNNFSEASLDEFDRFQEVRNVYRLKNGRLVLEKHPFTETWSPERKREKAAEILSGRYMTWCAFSGDRVVGEIMLIPEPNENRLIIDSFHVSRDHRRNGIGQRLVEAAADYAKSCGAKALYASCCSAQETIDFYLALGFRPSGHPIQACMEEEPCDIQMECSISDRVGEKILVLGCPGSGKSTFAGKLQKAVGLPLTHLDNVWWRSDGSNISRDEFDRKLDEILSAGQWIIDGDYSRTYEKRIGACDTVFFLDIPEEDCMKAVMERIGRKRPDLPWVETEPDPELLKIIQTYRTDKRPVLYELFRKYNKQVIVFKTRAEAETWLCRQTDPDQHGHGTVF